MSQEKLEELNEHQLSPNNALSADQIAFIQQHLLDAPASLLLKYGKTKAFEIEQIEARQKAKLKLPAWVAIPDLIFPKVVSVEQSSSEPTARYKASLISGQLLIDATGGMGIDTYFFSKHSQSVIYIEQNPVLVHHARHNFSVLKAKNIRCISGNSLDFLRQWTGKADWLYLDPARRASGNRRVIALTDCEPDVMANWSLLRQKARHLLIKASPLLDIKQTLLTLPAISRVHVVAIENECKELLFELSEEASTQPHCLITTINFKNDGTQQVFNFDWEEETNTVVALSNPARYVYEPNVAILKAGAFKAIAKQYQLAKIAAHSHLYTSANLVSDFPGRLFEVLAVVKADFKALVPFLPAGKANLTLRNFPGTTDELRKKLKLKEGGDVYLLATTLSNGDKRLLVCKKA
ncbi:MAG: class I SAM-dependent methyltransferase [Spirosomataceae bacterium]